MALEDHPQGSGDVVDGFTSLILQVAMSEASIAQFSAPAS